jgi:hypothetical protein
MTSKVERIPTGSSGPITPSDPTPSVRSLRVRPLPSLLALGPVPVLRAIVARSSEVGARGDFAIPDDRGPEDSMLRGQPRSPPSPPDDGGPLGRGDPRGDRVRERGAWGPRGPHVPPVARRARRAGLKEAPPRALASRGEKTSGWGQSIICARWELSRSSTPRTSASI